MRVKTSCQWAACSSSSFIVLSSSSFPLSLYPRSPRKGLMSPRLKSAPTKQVFGFPLPPGSVTSMTPVVSSFHPLESQLPPVVPMKITSTGSGSSSGISDEDSTDSTHSQEEGPGSRGNSDNRRCRKGSPHSVSPPIDVVGPFQATTNRRVTPPSSNRPGHLRLT